MIKCFICKKSWIRNNVHDVLIQPVAYTITSYMVIKIPVHQTCFREYAGISYEQFTKERFKNGQSTTDDLEDFIGYDTRNMATWF